jgi:hypothetical protein
VVRYQEKKIQTEKHFLTMQADNRDYNDEEMFVDSNEFEEIETKPDTDSLSRYMYRESTKGRQPKRKKKMVKI